MICCKIITDFSAENASFSELCKLLGKKGDWLWSNNAMYFADIDGDTDEKKIGRIIRKAGYKKFFIDAFDEKHEPHAEDSEYMWIVDKVTKIFYTEFTRKNYQILKQTDEMVKNLDKELDKLIDEAIEKQKDQKSDTTEEND